MAAAALFLSPLPHPSMAHDQLPDRCPVVAMVARFEAPASSALLSSRKTGPAVMAANS
jgi:hypothetical protein